MTRRLQEYALIAEIIGAIAIIVSLLFVAQQIQQSNNLAAADSLREGTAMWQRAYAHNLGSEEATSFMRKALNNYDDLSKDERGRFYAGLFAFVAAFDTLHNQYEAGLLREETYISIARWYYALMQTPGVMELFKENDMYLAPYLVDPESNKVFTTSGVELAPLPYFED